MSIFLSMSSCDLAAPSANHLQTKDKKKNGRKIDVDMENGMKDYFSSLPLRPSHYCARSEKQFLDFHTFDEMFKDYLQKCEKKKAKETTFQLFFHKNIKTKNISLKKLRKDCCNTCTSLAVKILELKKSPVPPPFDPNPHANNASDPFPIVVLEESYNQIDWSMLSDSSSQSVQSSLVTTLNTD
eukprot:TRINITY_DN2272_c0_g1_i1.p1 TRINITY_DN2272_c0_g1~~TRINITY_DN2272_c0_g1_i1.p1  ORF type:complete len:184 (-),score=24.78 TRINITY_DN2272_c0_g1_i1:83-634(-)